MKENVLALAGLGKIPDDDNMSDDLFRQYDRLLQIPEPLTFDEAELLIDLFSDDCDDLNWALLHLIETAGHHQTARYRELISGCSNRMFRELLETRLNNSLKTEQ